MARTVSKTVYQFSELSDEAKETAREWYRQGQEYGWGRESLESLEEWAKWFNVRIRDYSLGGSDNRSQGVKFDLLIDDNLGDLSGVRLWKYLSNQFAMPDLSGNCPFTGYCFDEVLLDTFRDFMKRPWGATYEELIQDCIDKFCYAYADDLDATFEDEAVDESIEANAYEFDEDGNRA